MVPPNSAARGLQRALAPVAVSGSSLLQSYEGGNRMLDALPRGDMLAMIGDLRIVTMNAREQAQEPGRRYDWVDFPIDAVYSVIAALSNGDACEVGTVGREGFIAAEASIGATLSRRTVVCQVPGRIARMRVENFRRALDASPDLTRLAHRNVTARLFAAEQFTTCNLKHVVVARCARWLLMTRDRVGRDRFPLTQDYLATMLGVRRAGVTQAAKTLRSLGALDYHRGTVAIIDARKLEAASCECYGATRDAFEDALRTVAVAS